MTFPTPPLWMFIQRPGMGRWLIGRPPFPPRVRGHSGTCQLRLAYQLKDWAEITYEPN